MRFSNLKYSVPAFLVLFLFAGCLSPRQWDVEFNLPYKLEHDCTVTHRFKGVTSTSKTADERQKEIGGVYSKKTTGQLLANLDDLFSTQNSKIERIEKKSADTFNCTVSGSALNPLQVLMALVGPNDELHIDKTSDSMTFELLKSTEDLALPTSLLIHYEGLIISNNADVFEKKKKIMKWLLPRKRERKSIKFKLSFKATQ